MNTSTTAGLTSVIVPCYNQVAFTQYCLQALFRFTRPAWELIVVDNGSTDSTGLYLAGVRDAATVPVTVIRNERNQGFPRAANQGLQAASGEYLVLLNNDAVVTDGWLDQLIALSSARLETTNGSVGEEAGFLTTKDTKDTKGRNGQVKNRCQIIFKTAGEKSVSDHL
jgi:O-antigen biosynthesis protein